MNINHRFYRFLWKDSLRVFEWQESHKPVFPLPYYHISQKHFSQKESRRRSRLHRLFGHESCCVDGRLGSTGMSNLSFQVLLWRRKMISNQQVKSKTNNFSTDGSLGVRIYVCVFTYTCVGPQGKCL